MRTLTFLALCWGLLSSLCAQSSTTQQAEAATYGGGSLSESNHLGHRGTGFINFPPSGGYTEFTGIQGGAAGGSATLRIRYALGREARTGELVVNGAASPLTFESTGGWDQWATTYIPIDLAPGNDNTVTLRSTGQDLANVDEITVWKESVQTCGTGTYIPLADSWSAHYWESDVFQGRVCRVAQQDASSLYAEVDHTDGGWDIALAYRYPGGEGIRVDDIPADLVANGRIQVNLTTTGNALWWAGPKVAVRKKGSSGLDGNYENYVIENASISPDEMHERRMRRDSARYLGTTTHDGAVYKHYYNPHRDWTQYWAVRQTYRTAGPVSLRPILQKWRQDGMPNEMVRNTRFNIEASRNSQGSVVISDLSIPMAGQPAADAGRILIRAKSSLGGEEMGLEVDGELVKRWDNVSRTGGNYTYDGYRGGRIRVIFDDNGGSRADGTDRNLGIDYLDVCGVRYENNAPGVTRKGCGTDDAGGFAWLWCNGYLDFGNPGCGDGVSSVVLQQSGLQRTDDAAATPFAVYPNPAHDQLTVVAADHSQLALYNSGGQLVLRRQLQGTTRLDVSHLPPGLYTVSLQEATQQFRNLRVVIQ